MSLKLDFLFCKWGLKIRSILLFLWKAWEDLREKYLYHYWWIKCSKYYNSDLAYYILHIYIHVIYNVNIIDIIDIRPLQVIWWSLVFFLFNSFRFWPVHFGSQYRPQSWCKKGTISSNNIRNHRAKKEVVLSEKKFFSQIKLIYSIIIRLSEA